MADKTDKTNTLSIAPPVTITAPAVVAEKTDQIKPKRLSKSARTYRRRLKQATHKPSETGR